MITLYILLQSGPPHGAASGVERHQYIRINAVENRARLPESKLSILWARENTGTSSEVLFVMHIVLVISRFPQDVE